MWSERCTVKTSGAQSYSSSAPCYRAPVRQQPQQCSINKSKIIAVFEFCSILDHPKLLVMAWILIQKFFNSLILWFSMNEWMCIYIPQMSHGGLQRYWVRSDISLWRYLWLPLSVHTWSHSPTQPMHEMWDETRDKPQHRELQYMPYSFR